METRKISLSGKFIGTIHLFQTSSTSLLKKMLEKVTKTNKTCALLGDFNVDLIKYGDNNCIDSFYDQVSSHGFAP